MFLEPLVTVLFPINRIDSFSLPALNSILTQTYRNLEILILDSTTSTNGLTEESFYKLAAKDVVQLIGDLLSIPQQEKGHPFPSCPSLPPGMRLSDHQVPDL